MLGMMSGQRVAVRTGSGNGKTASDIIAGGVRNEPDVHALASKDGRSLAVLVWNYHDDDVESASSMVELTIEGIDKSRVLVHHYRIDSQFSNSFERWKAMGRPQQVNSAQYSELENSGQLQLYTSPEWMTTTEGKLVLRIELPRQAVSLIQFAW
jgi:xylan 1,4-beta-xylosidase